MIVPVLTVVERKLLGRFQARYGPNRVGPARLLQPLADVLKLLGKEKFHPEGRGAAAVRDRARRWSSSPASRRSRSSPSATSRTAIGLYGIDVSIGILYFFAFGSLSLLRPAARRLGVGLEVQLPRRDALGRAADLLRDLDGPRAARRDHDGRHALARRDRRRSRTSVWYIVPQIVGFLIFMIAGFAETNRTPFDLPEADAELVPGYQTEYGGMRFGSFLMAEYMEMFVVSGIAVAFFLGGWMGPGPPDPRPGLDARQDPHPGDRSSSGSARPLPRLRYDQLMSLGWKVLLPLATLNVLVTAVLVVVVTMSEEFPYLKDDSASSRPARARAGRRRGAPTARSARRCAG